MDTTDDSSRAATLTNGAYPARCTQEVLVPVFTDESLQAGMDPQHRPASRCPPPALPELRLVLLGRKGAGKSAAGNTILGGAGGFESGRPTEECVKRRAEVEGRRVTVVDTPGWEWYYPLNSTPNWVRRETLRSVSLCPPGPHAVLLVVRSRASVTDAYLKEMEEHLQPLGGAVWEHAMVLFTRGDELGLGTMEQRILASGPALHRLLHKCRNRYHVVNNRCRGDGTQVKELLGKLEEMVNGGTEDGSSHLEMDGAVLTGLEADGKRRARERRKKQRQMEAHVQRGTIRAAVTGDGPKGSELDAHQSFSKAARRLPEIRLVLLGERETGKSCAGNAILGKPSFFPVGEVTEESIRRQAEVSMRLVTVVDTPGWEAGVAGGTPERVKRELVCSVALCPPGPHALLLTLRVDTLVRAEHVREHLELLGEGVWRHTVLLFTHGDQLREGVDIEQHIQGGGRDLQWLLEKCRRRYHVISSVNGAGGDGASARRVTDLLEKVEKMATMNRCEAFSGLVQEVRDLSRQRNEKFNQRLKEVADKMIRQEAELKNMREREMKSIRWFFDRKKKVKSHGKADVPREDEADEDRRAGERKSDIGDLEERIRWLTEDRERELQDLSLENERIRVALDQSRRESDEAALKLELKEREIEELRERSDEQQLKLLDLERTGTENQQERTRREDAIRAQTREWRKELEKREETIETLKEENAEWIETLNSFKVEMEQTRNREKQMTLDMLKQQEEVTERKCEEIKSRHEKEMERKMQEKELEIKEIRFKHQEEMDRKISEIKKITESLKVQQEKEIQKIMRENVDFVAQIKQKHDEEIQDIQRETAKHITGLEEQLEKEKQDKEKEMNRLEQEHYSKLQENRLENEKDTKRIHLNHQRDVRQQTEEREKQIKALTAQHEEAMTRRVNEVLKLMEVKTAELQEETQRRMKEKQEELERIEQQYLEKVRENELEGRKESDRLKEELAEETEKQCRERKQLISDLEKKHAEEIERIKLENSKEKEMLKASRDKIISQETEELKSRLHNMAGESEKYKEVMQEKEREFEEMKLRIEEITLQRDEREKEVEEARLKLEGLKEKLRQKEDKEIECLDDKRDVEEKLQERERELQGLKELEEKRERDRLQHRKETERALEEKDRVIEELRERVKDKDEILQRREEERVEIVLRRKEADQHVQDREREMEEWKRRLLNDTEAKLRERDAQVEDAKQQAEFRETRWREEQRRTEEKAAEEINRLIEILEKSEREARQTQSLLVQRDFQIGEHLKQIRELEGDIEGQRRREEEAKEKDEETKEKLREKDDGLERLRQRDAESRREVALLKSTIELTRSELTELTGKVEAETTSMIQGYEREIAKKNESAEVMAKERDAAVLRTEAESRRSIGVVTEQYEQSQRRSEELQEQNEKLKEEMESLKVRCDEGRKEREEEVEALKESKEELQAELERFKRREGESREQNEKRAEGEEESSRREREMEEREEELSRRGHDLDARQEELVRKELALASREEELKELEIRQEEGTERTERRQRRSEGLQKEGDDPTVQSEEVKEKEKEHPRRVEAILGEKELEMRAREGEREEEDEVREELGRRRRDLDERQEELREKGLTLARKEEELGKLAASLEGRQEELRRKGELDGDAASKARNVEKMERELESLLDALEGKQKELSSHGQDLQMKVRGLKDQGEELRERERHLQTGERQLLSWKSELQMQDRHVASTAQQLDEMGRDLALLKDELRSKERNLKAFFDKLSRWERSLEEREEELSDVANGHHGTGGTGGGSGSPLMYQEVSERREKGRGQGSDRDEKAKEREDQTVRRAENNNCQLETLKEPQTPEGNEATRKRKRKAREEAESAKVTRDFELLSGTPVNGEDPPDMSVVVLGESWSSCSPGGATLFGGEPPPPGRSTFRSWRGEVEGRRLAVAEPIGLRWRDGPDADGSQRRSVLDGASWCRPGPRVVLLLVPAFLTCTRRLRTAAEEHVGLLGEEIWRRALVLLTWAETLGESAEQHVLRNGELMALVERCGGGCHAITSRKNKPALKRLLEKMEEISAVNI